MSKYRKSFDDIYCHLWKILDKPKLSSWDRQRCKQLLKQMWREHHLGRFYKKPLRLNSK